MLYTLIGKKVGMTQVYDEQNQLIPVTVVQAGPCAVVQKKTQSTDGYNAIQIAFGPQKAHRLTKGQLGHFEKAGIEPHAHLREVRANTEPEQNPGDVLTVEGFEAGQMVDVVGETKGKGFQGVVKRFRYAGGPASHGSMFHRRGGSYGMCQYPGHVVKGKNMPGHMGNVRRTVQNLQVVKVLPEKNLLLLKGSVPGANGDILTVRTAKKTRTKQAA